MIYLLAIIYALLWGLFFMATIPPSDFASVGLVCVLLLNGLAMSKALSTADSDVRGEE